MDIIANVAQKVEELLNADNSGHGFEHVERVWKMAEAIYAKEGGNKDVVALGALLHDVDDYKIFGQTSADNLTNAKKIMQECGVEDAIQKQVCDIVYNMGYSKLLAGIRPKTIEGKIVSDADMLDALGINGIIRTLQYAFMRCQKYGKPIFDKEAWPELNLSAEEYKKSGRRSDNCINHFFEKTLKLKDLMLTEEGRKKAIVRHNRMVMFLEGFFEENDVPEWGKFLQEFLSQSSKEKIAS